MTCDAPTATRVPTYSELMCPAFMLHCNPTTTTSSSSSRPHRRGESVSIEMLARGGGATSTPTLAQLPPAVQHLTPNKKTGFLFM